MITLDAILPALLTAAAIGQAAVALLNLRLDRLLHWETELAGLSLLLREVFYVHKWFISVTLAIFAVITLRFAHVLGTLEIGRWLAGGIAIFWAIRTAIQLAYYSSSHWRGRPARLAIHLILLAAYGGCALVYGLTAAGFAEVR